MKTKNVRPPAELIQAVKAYFYARAAAETLRPRCLKIQAEVLDAIGAEYDAKWSEGHRHTLSGRITDPKDSFLMSEAHAALYYPALDAAYRAAGFDVPEGYCPLLMAESAQRDAERNVLNAAVAFHGHAQLASDKLYRLEDRAAALDLVLRYVAQFVR